MSEYEETRMWLAEREKHLMPVIVLRAYADLDSGTDPAAVRSKVIEGDPEYCRP